MCVPVVPLPEQGPLVHKLEPHLLHTSSEFDCAFTPNDTRKTERRERETERERETHREREREKKKTESWKFKRMATG